MPATLLIKDESGLNTNSLHTFTLDFLTEHISVRELIRSRVYQEVQDYNVHQPEYFQGLVQPSDAERTLNGYRMRTRRLLDWQKQYERALYAFGHNGFIILVNDRQVEDLDTIIEIRPETEVTFLKLVQLVGG